MVAHLFSLSCLYASWRRLAALAPMTMANVSALASFSAAVRRCANRRESARMTESTKGGLTW